MKLSLSSIRAYKELEKEGFVFDYENLISSSPDYYGHSNYTLNSSYHQKYKIIIMTERTRSNGGYKITIKKDTITLYICRCTSLLRLTLIFLDFKKFENSFLNQSEVIKIEQICRRRKKYIAYHLCNNDLLLFRKNRYLTPIFVNKINKNNILKTIDCDILIERLKG